MAEETGKTVKATLKILIDAADAKRQKKDLDKDLDALATRYERRAYSRRNSGEQKRERDEARKREKEERDHLREVENIKKRINREADIERRKIKNTADRYVREDLRAEGRQHIRRQREAAREEHNLQNTAEHYIRRDFRMRNRLQEKAEARQLSIERNRGRLPMQSLALMGAGGFAGKVGQIQTYGQLLEAAGMPGIGGAVARHAPGIGAVSMFGSMGVAASKFEANPYASEDQVSQQMYKKYIPFYESGQALSGTLKQAELAKQRVQFGGIRQDQYQKGYAASMDWRAKSEDAGARAEAFHGFSTLGTLPTANRGGSELEQRRYQEQLTLMPALQDKAKADAELAAATKQAAAAARRRADLEKEYKKTHEAGVNQAKSGARGNVSSTIMGGMGEAVNTLDRAKRLGEMIPGAMLEEKERQAAVVRAQEAQRQSAIKYETAKLGVLEGRESFATERAQSIGGMGMGGRVKAKMMLQMVKDNPEMAEYLSPEMLNQAASIDPTGVAKIRENVGKKDIAENEEWYKKYAPDVAGNQLDKTRADVDEQRKKVTGMGDTNTSQTASDMARVYGKEFAQELMNAFMDVVKTALEKIKTEGRLDVQKDIVGGSTK